MKHATSIGMVVLLVILTAGIVLAEGFGTPSVDGQYDAVYGIAEASDPSGDHWDGLNAMDMLDLYVCNDNNFWYFYFTVNENLSTTTWGKYLLYIDTTNDMEGAIRDAWGRKTVAIDPNKPEFSLNTWVDGQPYGPEDTQFWVWTQAGSTWAQLGTADGAGLTAGTTSGIEYKLARSRVGDPDTIWVEVWSTGETGNPPAQDTSNDPADDWNASNWDDTAFVAVSTKVAVQSGGDTTPPTLDNAFIIESNLDTLIAQFSEPLAPGASEDPGNYTVTGVNVIGANLQDDSSEVLLTLDADMGLGSCLVLEAVNVEDRAAIPIVDNDTTNVYEFYLTELTFNVHMKRYLREYSADPDPDTVALEGSMSPLTWGPTCDDLLTGPDTDSVFTGDFVFMHTCTDEVTDTVNLEYKFTHQCVTWESIDNHGYMLTGEFPRDTLEIWWNDEAPSDFTDKDIDVIFRAASSLAYQWDMMDDSIGIAGSEWPLTWDTDPATNLLNDEGGLPDSTAGDNIFSTRITFPTGSRKDVEFKYAWKGMSDTLYNFECLGQENRNVYLDDLVYSTTTPIVIDLNFWDICIHHWWWTINPVDDATVDAANPDSTYGTIIPSMLHVGEFETNGDIARGCLKFDIGSWLPPTAFVTHAYLRIELLSSFCDSFYIDCWEGDSDNWNENTVTWNYQNPGASRFLDRQLMNPSGGIESWKVTDAVRDCEDDYVTLVLRAGSPAEGDSCVAEFWSKDQSDYLKPWLSIWYTTTTLTDIAEGEAGEESGPPARFGLEQNVPNPFNPTTKIRFTLPEPGHVFLTVHDVSGRRVAVLVDEPCLAREYAVPWHGRNDQGEEVGSGIYFARLKAGDFVATRKMVLLR